MERAFFRVDRRRLYPWVGLLLAQGAPLGILVMRAIMLGANNFGFVAKEVRHDPALYLYATFSTSAVFVAAGYILGRASDRLYATATTDPLTGLYNRRSFDERLLDEFGRARRYHSPVSLILIDMDGLKTLNDRAGHAAGDQALSLIAEVVRRSSRSTDLPARIGGDEFAILAPGIEADSAFRFAERLREDIHRASTGLERSLTVSVGVAELDASIKLPEELLQRADAALYAAKRGGRNQTSRPPPHAHQGASGAPRRAEPEAV